MNNWLLTAVNKLCVQFREKCLVEGQLARCDFSKTYPRFGGCQKVANIVFQHVVSSIALWTKALFRRSFCSTQSSSDLKMV